jgi:predicted nucleic acid-binding protein
MSDRSFFDTNVLTYSDDHDAPDKQATALDLIEQSRRSHNGVLSTQVLQEYFVTATRKLGVPAPVAKEKVRIFAHFATVFVSVDDVLAAIDLHQLHKLNFWDSLIVRTALTSGCSVLYTEDMQHGRRFDGLQIVNPFV